MMIELREVRCAAPAYQDVAVGQYLRVALGIRKQFVGMGILAYQAGTHFIFVDLDRDGAGLFCSDHVAVIEDSDCTLGVAAGVLLKDGPDPLIHLGVALLSAPTPD